MAQYRKWMHALKAAVWKIDHTDFDCYAVGLQDRDDKEFTPT
jgi:hypothetical protein